jgi:hypothetical protein
MKQIMVTVGAVLLALTVTNRASAQLGKWTSTGPVFPFGQGGPSVTTGLPIFGAVQVVAPDKLNLSPGLETVTRPLQFFSVTITQNTLFTFSIGGDASKPDYPNQPGVKFVAATRADLDQAVKNSTRLGKTIQAAVVIDQTVAANEIIFAAPPPGAGLPAPQSFRVKTQPTKGKGATVPGNGTPAGKADSKAKGATVRGTITQASKATVSLTANKQTRAFAVSDRLTKVIQQVNGKDTPASLAQLQQALKANPRGVTGSVTVGPATAAGSRAAVIRYTLPSRATTKR